MSSKNTDAVPDRHRRRRRRRVLIALLIIAGFALLLLGILLPSLLAQGSNNNAATVTLQAQSALPVIRVYSDPDCTCCKAWIKTLRTEGFTVDVHADRNMAAIKDRLGVPTSMRSCHTATVGHYFIEGHVPAADIKRLLRESSPVRGLALPGMHAGSPGMEPLFGHGDPFTVDAVDAGGTPHVYAVHRDGQ